ncbi:hypothetical protein fHeYen801_109 [Yersinia phage fHe-Yen8-01]|nr:hypothetical protein fHeYen801_109 [Yersinia phage fHe-Yen8-01]
MADKCEKGCVTGMIGMRRINEGRWSEAVALFNEEIDEWNELTKRKAIPHPGFANKFVHCPDCGHKLKD